MAELIQDDLELKGLEQFISTEQYYDVLGFNVTDGVKYIMDNGYSWFVTDVLAVIKCKKNVSREEFLSIKFDVLGQTGKVIITDGNEKTLYTQDYDYTDAKRSLHLYFTNGVLLLSGEY